MAVIMVMVIMKTTVETMVMETGMGMREIMDKKSAHRQSWIGSPNALITASPARRPLSSAPLIETPIGKYNPDWAVVKHESETVYLVKETKGTKDFLKLRTSEADKVRCGKKHFAALGVPFAVVVSADEV